MFSAVKIRAKRWDSKKIDQLKQKRDEYQVELKKLQGERRKAPGLLELRSLIQGLEAKLKWTKRDKETIVSCLPVVLLINKIILKII